MFISQACQTLESNTLKYDGTEATLYKNTVTTKLSSG